MPKLTVLLAGVALVVPTAVLTAPTEAATEAATEATTEATSAKVTNCSKTRHGVTVRIKIRDEGRFARVQVSHPRGKGNFREPRLRWVKVAVSHVGAPSFDEDGTGLGGGASMTRARDRGPSFRTTMAHTTSIHGTFKLRTGPAIHLECQARR